MKSLTHLVVTVFSACVITLGAAEKEKASHRYEGKITGLYCSACASKVKAALGKLEGVNQVKITSTDEQGVQKILLDSTSDRITKEAAIKALGEDARSFTVLSLDHAGE